MEIKNNYYLIAGIFLIIISIILSIYSSTSLDRVNKKYTDFTIVNKENDNSYLYVYLVYMNNDGYYIVNNNNKLYVVKSNVDLTQMEFDGKYIRVVGKSKSFDSETINKITQIYNEKTDEIEFMISSENFNTEFGNYYLEFDKIIDDTDLGNISKSFSKLFLEIGIVLLVAYIIKVVIERKKQIY